MSQDEQKLPDTAQKASPAASLSDAEVLQAIKEKIKEYFAEDRELFRGLCELYCGSGIGLERYRKLLIKANLLKSRASEITVVLKQTKICARFLSKTQPTLTWSEALQAARDAAPNAAERLGARLADLLVEKEAFWPDGRVHGEWKLQRDALGQHAFIQPGLGTLAILNLAADEQPQ